MSGHNRIARYCGEVSPISESERRAVRASRRTALLVNLAKIALLAALAPPVVAGIAERATAMESSLQTATIVAFTISAGSIGAVVGALGLGFLADTGSRSLRARWAWVVVGAGLGTCGLILMILSTSPALLVSGWVVAQLGYSGAMAVLRAILAHAMLGHRRRGAVVIVAGAYGGLLVPLLTLLFFPMALWQTTFALAALALAIPAGVVVALTGTFHSKQQELMPRPSAAPEVPPARDSRNTSARRGGAAAIPTPLLLGAQLGANAVTAAFLTYHPLDMALRSSADHSNVPASMSVLIAAIGGLVIATSVLFWRADLLRHGTWLIIGASAALSLSLVLRSTGDSLTLVALGALISGAAVGANNSALLGSALEMPDPTHRGRFLGAFSAAGALGQFIGPLGALALLQILSRSGDAGLENYPALFLSLSAFPLVWIAALLVHRSHHRATT